MKQGSNNSTAHLGGLSREQVAFFASMSSQLEVGREVEDRGRRVTFVIDQAPEINLDRLESLLIVS
jgi:hypothetical protein